MEKSLKNSSFSQGGEEMYLDDSEFIYEDLYFAKEVLNGMADWVKVVDFNGIVIYANDALKDVLGYDPKGLENEKLNDFFDCEIDISRSTMQENQVIQREVKIFDKYCQVKSSPIYDDGKNIVASVEVYRDMTRERKLELQLIKNNEAMTHDMEFTKRIQESILPAKGLYKGFSVDYLYEATEMLSGDMFDIFELDGDSYVIYIADVAGHGIAASILTMFLRQTLRSISYDKAYPNKALNYLNEKFNDLNLHSERYITIFYGVYNTLTKEFIYANAGHNSFPIVYGNGKLKLLESSGYPISSLSDKYEYEEKIVKLRRGDSVLFYTDGIIEQRDNYGREFGVDRLIHTVNTYEGSRILKAIDFAVLQHSWGEQKDDFAMMTINIK